jgi:subtilisin-like proprotein convertase family protein
MKILILPVFSPILATSAWAASSVTESFPVGSTVPDNNPVGLSDTRQITTPITGITKVTVGISMSGGWAGDLYAYLSHGSGFTVLLNRPGRTLVDVAGSGVSEFTVEFDDDAAGDIHTAIPSSGSASGFFQPDAREADPDLALDSSPRSAFLSSFTGLDPNGEWTLFVADVSPGEAMVLDSWTLKVEGVPEPATITSIATSVLFGLLRRRRGKD